MDHLNDLMGKVKCASTLRLAGFLVPQRRTVFYPYFDTTCMEGELDLNIIQEDEHAHTFGTGVLATVKARAFRGIWMFFSPVMFYGGIDDHNKMNQMILEFKVDVAISVEYAVSMKLNSGTL